MPRPPPTLTDFTLVAPAPCGVGDQAIQGGDLVEAHSQQHHHAQEAGFAPQDDRYRRHPETERGIIQELRAELEAEKGAPRSGGVLEHCRASKSVQSWGL